MFKKLLLIFVLAFTLMSIQPSSVFACSGYSYFSVDDLPTMELLVRATVMESDDRGFNAILRIEEYYKGAGPQFLTVMRYSPGLETGAYMRGYDTGCLYAGRGQRYRDGRQGYFGLRPNGNGTYTDSLGGLATAHFYPVDGEITYQEGMTEGYALEFDDPLTISEEDFIDKMLELGERDAPIPPTTDATIFYPLKRFLTITTESGTRYQVNPDRSVIELDEDAPIAISPDGSHIAFQVDEETIAFQYIWTNYNYDEITDENRDEAEEFQRPGQAVSFSSDSSFAAVWDMTHLAIYMLANNGANSLYGYGTGMNIHEVAQVDFVLDDNSTLPQVLWSADGSTLVWQDGKGIWHWNIMEEAEPTHILEIDANVLSEGLPELEDVSRYGRYVRVNRPDDWILIDSETQQIHVNAITSPNEDFVVYINPSPMQLRQGQDDGTYCTPPLRENCIATVHTQDSMPVTSFFDMPVNLIGLVMCVDNDDNQCYVTSMSWHPAIGRTGYFNRIRAVISELRHVTYDMQYEQPALLVGDYQIYFSFYSDGTVENEEYHPYLDWLNLEGVVDSPIVSIEWGQPIFYDDYMLSTLQYRPR